MSRAIIFCFLFFLTTNTALSQQFKSLYRQADTYFNLDAPTAKTDSVAAAMFLKVADIAWNSGDHETSIESFIKAGSIRQTYHRYVEANEFYKKAINLNSQSLNDTALFYRAYLYLGSSYYSLGRNDSAATYFEKASTLSIFHPQSADFPEQERLYNSLGTIHFESANYQQAKNYFEKALKIIEPKHERPDESVITLQSNVANCMMRLRQYAEAVQLFRKLLKSGIQTRVISHNIAHAYAETKQYDSALFYFKSVERQQDVVTVRMMNDLGRIFTAQEKWKDASSVLDSSLVIINSLFNKAKNRDRTLNYLIRSLLSEAQSKNDEAIKWCNEAIREVHFRFAPKNIYDVPENETESLSPVTFLELLQQKARLLEEKFNQTHDRAALNACFRTHLLATHTASYIKRCFDNDEAKMYFQQDNSAVYHDALRVGHQLMDGGKAGEYLDGILEINEAYKGSIVYDNIRHLELSARVKLPAWVTDKERALKRSLAFFTTQLNNADSPDESRTIRENLVAANVELSRLLSLYDSDPAYQLYRNQRSPGLHTYKSIAGRLDDETAIISFNVTSSNVYSLAVTKSGFITHTIVRDSTLTSAFKNFVQEIYSQTEGKRYVGYQPSNELYKYLVAPLLDLIGSKKNWVIMPDDFLSYLPFDALCINTEQRDYLLSHHQVSYHYSFSLLFDGAKELKPLSTKQTLFFAPFTKETPAVAATGLALLPFSGAEAVDRNLVGRLSSDATKANWLAAIESSTTLHLATHATTGNGRDSSAQINFYPSDSSRLNNNLYVDEIYRLNLQHTNLVVLSACETAGGQSTSGEGLLSLSRAFLYAGSKGIISSLWKTEDGVSSYLMQQMYAKMNKGLSTEAAIREAKMEFLHNESISARYKTPNYWSNFVYVGSVQISSKSSYTILWIIAGVLLILPAGYLLYKKATQRKAG